jgi:hypothetical protein
MTSPKLNRRERGRQAAREGLREEAGLESGTALVTPSGDDATPSSRTSAQPPVGRRLVTGRTSTALVIAQEVLVADARNGLTPAQMVDRQLLALLGYGHPGLFIQAVGRPGAVRRLPGE